VPLDPASAWANGRITLPGLAARNELRVAAECAYSRSGTGVHREDSADGSVHIYAKLAQAYARTAYACFDQPDLKSVFTFQITTPAHWTVLSNQPQDHAERTRGNSWTRRFLPTPRLPTFTTTVVAGDYHVVTATHTTPGGQQIPLELACRADLADRLDADALFQLTAKGLDYYTRWLGADYPYAKYGQVFVPEEAHAQADLGLNPYAWSTMSLNMKIPAFADDRLPSAHPVASGASTVSEAIANFDGITYAKGAAAVVSVRGGGELHCGAARLHRPALLRQCPAGGLCRRRG
jgi:aminopeptidase N